jgi:AraC family transcriptional regulator
VFRSDAWFGEREPRPRNALFRKEITASRINFAFVTEQITAPTDWWLHEREHIIAVHSAGRPMSMEFEFEGGPSGRTISQVGDVWVIPAEKRRAAIVKVSTVEFCEMRLPTVLFGDRTLDVRIRNRDPFLVALIGRLNPTAIGDGALARLLTESLATTLHLHLTDRAGSDAELDERSRRELTSAQQTSLIEFLEDGLDADISLKALAATAFNEVDGVDVISHGQGQHEPHGQLRWLQAPAPTPGWGSWLPSTCRCGLVLRAMPTKKVRLMCPHRRPSSPSLTQPTMRPNTTTTARAAGTDRHPRAG